MGGGSELGWVEHQAHPPLGHCPCDVINLKNAPTLGHSQAPPPLDIARVTSSTYSKGGTKLLKGGTKSLGWGNWGGGGGVVRPPPPGYGPVICRQMAGRSKIESTVSQLISGRYLLSSSEHTAGADTGVLKGGPYHRSTSKKWGGGGPGSRDLILVLMLKSLHSGPCIHRPTYIPGLLNYYSVPVTIT